MGNNLRGSAVASPAVQGRAAVLGGAVGRLLTGKCLERGEGSPAGGACLDFILVQDHQLGLAQQGSHGEEGARGV